MVTPSTLALFAAASIALIAVPGPAVGAILATTLRRGRTAGLATTAGVELGNLVHVVAATVGISAVLAASATAFTVIKIAGAAWLLWLAVRSWRARTPGTVGDLAGTTDGPGGVADAVAQDLVPRRGTSLAAEVRAGALVGALNPKTALFFIAFLPQFVRPDAGPVWAQMLTLGLVFVALACVGDGLWALGGAGLRRVVPHVRLRALDRVSAAVYAAMGVLTLTARRLA